MQKYILIILLPTFIISIIFITVVIIKLLVNIEGFDAYETEQKMTDDVRFLIGTYGYDKGLLQKQDISAHSLQTQSASQERQDYNEGKADCVYEWNEWSTCDAVCSGDKSGKATGKKRRTIKTPIIYPRNGGAQCPPPEEETCEIKTCNVDCELELLSTSTCEGECDKCQGAICDRARASVPGTFKTTYNIKVKPKNQGKQCEAIYDQMTCNENTCVRTQDCTKTGCPVDCKLSSTPTRDSTPVSISCDRKSTTGTQVVRDRYLEVRSMQNGGNNCDPSRREALSTIPKTDCPVDCVGNWICPSLYGLEYLTYNITTYPQNNGQQCPHQHGYIDQNQICTFQSNNNYLRLINTGKNDQCFHSKDDQDWMWNDREYILWEGCPRNRNKNRLNLLTDGTLQSSLDNNYYLCIGYVGSLSFLKKEGSADKSKCKFKLRSDNKMQYIGPGCDNCCMKAYDKGARIWLDKCETASTIGVTGGW